MSYRRRVYRPDNTWWVDLFEDDVNRTVTTYNEAGSTLSTRPYTAAENANLDQRLAADNLSAATTTLLQQLAAGVANIQAVRASANSDIAVAESQRSGAVTVKGQATAQRTQVAAFVPSATYKASDLTAIRDAITAILDRQAVIIQAIVDLAAYRKANDESTLITDDSLLWLARLASGVIVD